MDYYTISKKYYLKLTSIANKAYLAAQNEYIETIGLKPGDKVKIITKPQQFECGWLCESNMTDDMLNGEFTVKKIDYYGITLENDCVLPFFALEKIVRYNFKDKDIVLVKNNDDEYWALSAFKEYDEKYGRYPYQCYSSTGFTGWVQCIPYTGNEHLLGTNTVY